MSNSLIVSCRGSGTTYSLIRLNQGLSFEVIASVSGAALTALTTTERFGPRAKQLGDRLFFIADNKVFQMDVGGSPSAVLINIEDANARAWGFLLVFMHPTDGLCLGGVTGDGSNANFLKYVYSTDTWSLTPIGGGSVTGNFDMKGVCRVGGKFFWASFSRIYEFDPVLASITNYELVQAVEIWGYDGKVYCIKLAVSTGAPIEFGLLIGGSFSKISDITGSESNGAIPTGRPTIYNVGTDIFVVANKASATDDGWVAGKWDGTTYTDVTTTLLPPALRSGGSLAANSRGRRGEVYKVQTTTETKTFILVTLDELSTASIQYEHVGSTWVTRNTSNWSFNYSQVQNSDGGGDWYFTPTEISALPVGVTVAVANGIKQDFTVHGNAGSNDTYVALYYSLEGTDWVRATIEAPSGGVGGSASIAGNQLLNVDADGDTVTPTTYSLVHNFSADGLSSNIAIWHKLLVSKTSF